MSKKATLSIDIWTHTPRGRDKLPEDFGEALAPHVEHVAKMCEQGFLAGEIVDEMFKGWWKITEHEGGQP